MDMSHEIMEKFVRRYAHAVEGISLDSALEEVCDFGASYGFLFESDDKYGNHYWCIDKKTFIVSAFSPNADIKMFSSRKIISKDWATR